MSTPDSGRTARLNKLFATFLYGKRSMRSPADAKLYLEAICSQANAVSCVERLVASPPGLSALEQGLRFDVSAGFINQHTTPFLRYLSDPGVKQVCGGQHLQQILQSVAKPPSLWNALLSAFRQYSLNQESLKAFAWLVLELLSLPPTCEIDISDDAQAILSQGTLQNDSDETTRNRARKIEQVVNTKALIIPPDTEFSPGGRHDNDFADFRKISIYPTAAELLASERPFYRRAMEIGEAPLEQRAAIHLDNQYRLLREDMLAEMRNDLQVAQGRRKGRRSAVLLHGLRLQSIECGDSDTQRWKTCSLGVTCAYGLAHFAALEPKGRKDFLAKNRYFLKHESFGCLLHDSEIIAFASVDRDEEALCRKVPVVMLTICGSEALKKALLALKLYSNVQFLVVDTPVFAYEPVLRCLQEKVDLPLATQILDPKSPSALENVSHLPASFLRRLKKATKDNISAVLATKKKIILDDSQLESLIAGLMQKFSLIQGPPGTGKSFLGALIAKALYDETSLKILVVCYTNHALDQFLEDLLDIGIPAEAIGRLGSKAKCTPRTAPLCVSAQSGTYRPNRSSYDVINHLKFRAASTQSQMARHLNWYHRFQIRWHDIMELLEFSDEESDFYEAFTVPDDADGMVRVGKDGRPVHPDYLFKAWQHNMDAGIFEWAVRDEHRYIWNMAPAARQALIQKWEKLILEDRIAQLHGSITEMDDLSARLVNMFGEKSRHILREKRIIGCTTTGAAKYASDLQAASPEVLLVEEAGEILESHILTALSSNTQQIILIGDHKQLRPKVNSYELTVEKGEGFDLNRSLFERLVLAGYPHTILTKQHRMCPEISTLVRKLTYPELLDDDKTKQRPPIRGLQDRVIFFNHDNPEHEVNEVGDARDGGSKSSKKNVFEAELVLKIVKYLAQQGYGTDRLVVLTPYIGQLFLLKEKLSEENDPVLNDLDSYDLIRAGLVSHASAQLTKRPIRLSTIDNYQGEEADIVVASLTRSNERGDIGFLAAPERLNVLLSRARDALIMIGNAATFRESRKGQSSWVSLFDHLVEHGHLYDGLPVKCERHHEWKRVLRTAKDFDTECPDGGCPQPCDTLLSCKLHKCPQQCHQLFDHSKMQCNKIVDTTCSRGHHQFQPCWKLSKGCRKCADEDREQERKRERDAKLEEERERKRKEYVRELAEIQAEMDHERRIAKDLADDQQRLTTIKQSRIDLENMRSGRLQRTAAQTKTADDSATVDQTSESDPVSPEKTEASQNAATETWTSSANSDWEYQKEFEGAKNAALDSLMKMIGLEEVKEKFLSIKGKVDTAIRQKIDCQDERFGAALLGNPGTGKTTVARLYAQFLTSIGALPGSKFVETTGSRLANDGVSGCKKIIEGLLNDGGGALFIDEAYQLTGTSYGGGAVLDFLLAEIENLKGKIVFILAGYNKQMESFFAHNPGIPSRFPIEMQFKDYTDDELLRIFVHTLEKKYRGQMKVEGGLTGLYSRIVARRIGHGRGREGFGNARAVENRRAMITERQASRLSQERRVGQKPDDFLLTKEDLLGPEPSKALKESEEWKKLQGLIGLKAVKDSVKALFETLQSNYQRELAEKPIIEFSLNRVFLGPPGTGKTSVAKLYGAILASMGLLSNGEVVVKNPSDFVGSVMGESEKNTKGILAASEGKVLVIDEAYGLSGNIAGSDSGGSFSDPYRTAVVDTIVAEVQSTPGENRCVLLLGYKDEMEKMFQHVNPGLSRRFPLDSAFVFEDFTDEELSAIFDLKVKQQGLEVTHEGKKTAMEVLRRARNRPNFGNAGEIDILLDKAKASQQARFSSGDPAKRSDQLEPWDFDKDYDRGKRAETNIRMLFGDTIGCEGIVEQLEGYQRTARNVKVLDMDPRDHIPFNFLFRGPPGTGKTTTARKTGKVYYDMGFLSTAEVVECSATNLVGQYIGQTGPKTQAQLEKALGRVLFVDEAYRLADSVFAKEAMDEIVDCITKPKFAKKLIIILAGYEGEIDKLMQTNPGLASRFSDSVNFTSLAPKDCVKLLTTLLRKQKHKLAQKSKTLDITDLEAPSPAFAAELDRSFGTLAQLPNWGNARDVETIGRNIFAKAISSQHLEIDEEMIRAVIDHTIEERTERANVENRAPNNLWNPLLPSAPPRGQNPFQATHNTKQGKGEKKQGATPGKPDAHSHPRDAGVSDADWQHLQKCAADAAAREEAYAKLVAKEKALERARLEAQKQEEKAKEEERQRLKAAADDEERRRVEAERIARELKRRAIEAELERLRKEREKEEARKREEAKAQRKLQEMGVCCAGFRWIKVIGGYRCAGGAHFVPNEQLK